MFSSNFVGVREFLALSPVKNKKNSKISQTTGLKFENFVPEIGNQMC